MGLKVNDYQDRVCNEYVELNIKIEGLRAFIGGDIFEKLGLNERYLLREQLKYMCVYSMILGERINGFNGG